MRVSICVPRLSLSSSGSTSLPEPSTNQTHSPRPPFAFLDQPMKIDLIVDPIRAVPLASRVAPAPAVVKAAAPLRFVFPVSPLSIQCSLELRRSGPGAARRRRGGAPRRAPKAAPKTAADLDAEMEVGYSTSCL